MLASIHGFHSQDSRGLIRILQAVRAFKKRVKRCWSHLDAIQNHDSKRTNRNRVVNLTQPDLMMELNNLVSNIVWGLTLDSFPHRDSHAARN